MMTNGYIPIDMKFVTQNNRLPGIYKRITEALRTGKPLLTCNTNDSGGANTIVSRQLVTSVITTLSNGNYGVKMSMAATGVDIYVMYIIAPDDMVTRTFT